MNNIIILSNTCIGYYIYRDYLKKKYDNPFIGSIFINDLDYINLVNNMNYYINIEPKIGQANEKSLFNLQSKNKYYYHKTINYKYVVIYLENIEIHFIHEKNENTCLDKFKVRWNRFKKLFFLKDTKIYSLLSFSELLNDHKNLEELIDLYLKTDKNNINKLFLGPSNLDKNNDEKYIKVDEWNNISLERSVSHIYKFNNQTFSVNQFIQKIKKL
jgi:uncharacterized protein (DUF1919 family)